MINSKIPKPSYHKITKSNPNYMINSKPTSTRDGNKVSASYNLNSTSISRSFTNIKLGNRPKSQCKFYFKYFKKIR